MIDHDPHNLIDRFLRADKLREYTPLPCVHLAIFAKSVLEEPREDCPSVVVFMGVFSMILNEESHHQFTHTRNRTALRSRK